MWQLAGGVIVNSLPLLAPRPTADNGESKDSLRVISTKGGAFRELADGKPTGREFVLVETRDHFFFQRFTDNGELRKASGAITTVYVADCLRSGSMVEVRQ